MKAYYQMLGGAVHLYRMNSKGEYWFWNEKANEWTRSYDDDPWNVLSTPAKQARKQFPDAFKKGVKLP